jgi:two-component system response regulator RegA
MSGRTILLVEDDAAFARTLKRSFEKRGDTVHAAASPADARELLATGIRPSHAVVDLKLGQESGLTVVRDLHAHDPELVIVVLTGYASIATAVDAVKLGAANYLVKPSNTDDIEAAFAGEALPEAEVQPIAGRATSIKTLEMERIHEVLAETGFNISETARRLGMHRRTLARKLAKRWVS